MPTWASAVDNLAGVIAVGDEGAQALVLADEPATSCYLPQHRAFLRRHAAGSEAELTATAIRVLDDPATAWQDYCTWTTDGPAVLMDSANAGTDLGVQYPGGGLPDQAAVPLPQAPGGSELSTRRLMRIQGRPGPPPADQPIRGAHALVDEGVERLKA